MMLVPAAPDVIMLTSVELASVVESLTPERDEALVLWAELDRAYDLAIQIADDFRSPEATPATDAREQGSTSTGERAGETFPRFLSDEEW